MQNENSVELDKPGAGLPFFERILARYFFLPRQTRRLTWDQNVDLFKREVDRIGVLTKTLSREKMTTCVLIPRIRGIEDSSRYWSVAMTLEHLTIVNRAMASIIVELSQGRVPPIEVNIAKVKPQSSLDYQAALKDYLSTSLEVEQKLSSPQVLDRNSSAKLLHPWFGPITAHQWNWLLGVHQATHRRQIAEILKGLS